MEKMTFGESLFNKKKKPFIGVDTVILGFLIVILLFLVSLVSFTSLCLVDGDSMNATLTNKQYVLLNKSQEAAAGDIIVFGKGSKNYIKRVIAVGGETIRFVEAGIVEKITQTGVVEEIACVKTQKLVGGAFEDMDEGFINDGYMEEVTGSTAAYDVDEIITIPDGHYFVMGDNRNHSEDSRRTMIGLVAKEQVLGKVIYRIAKGSMDEWLLTLLFSSGLRGT